MSGFGLLGFMHLQCSLYRVQVPTNLPYISQSTCTYDKFVKYTLYELIARIVPIFSQFEIVSVGLKAICMGVSVNMFSSCLSGL